MRPLSTIMDEPAAAGPPAPSISVKFLNTLTSLCNGTISSRAIPKIIAVRRDICGTLCHESGGLKTDDAMMQGHSAHETPNSPGAVWGSDCGRRAQGVLKRTFFPGCGRKSVLLVGRYGMALVPETGPRGSGTVPREPPAERLQRDSGHGAACRQRHQRLRQHGAGRPESRPAERRCR